MRTINAWLTLACLLTAAPVLAADQCGDADASGSITVTDGVQTLRAAAGLTSTCTVARCDLDDSGTVSVTDGVNVLRAAAGLSVVLACPGAAPPCESLTATIALEVPEPIGAANLTVAYPTAAVTLPGSGEDAAARVTVLTAASLFQDGSPNDFDDRVGFTVVALDGVGSGPLFAVRFDCLAAAPAASTFPCTLDTVRATDGVTEVTGASCRVTVTSE